MRNLNFTTKEEYLQYRKDWKEEYRQVCGVIREKKWAFKEYSRMWNKAMIAHGNPSLSRWGYGSDTNSMFWKFLEMLAGENILYTKLHKKYGTGLWNFNTHRKEATNMLEELKIAKRKSQKQYLSQKNLFTPNVSYLYT